MLLSSASLVHPVKAMEFRAVTLARGGERGTGQQEESEAPLQGKGNSPSVGRIRQKELQAALRNGLGSCVTLLRV